LTAGGGGRRRFVIALSSLSATWALGASADAELAFDSIVDVSGVCRLEPTPVGGIWGAGFGASGSGAGCKSEEFPIGVWEVIRACLPDNADVISSTPLR
jgi:hypothetical protein